MIAASSLGWKFKTEAGTDLHFLHKWPHKARFMKSAIPMPVI